MHVSGYVVEDLWIRISRLYLCRISASTLVFSGITDISTTILEHDGTDHIYSSSKVINIPSHYHGVIMCPKRNVHFVCKLLLARLLTPIFSLLTTIRYSTLGCRLGGAVPSIFCKAFPHTMHSWTRNGSNNSLQSFVPRGSEKFVDP